jgi:hypothetical protein
MKAHFVTHWTGTVYNHNNKRGVLGVDLIGK